MILAKHATFLWDDDDDMLIMGVVVVDQTDPPLTADEHARERSQDWNYDLSYGACCAGWMEGDFRLSPEGLFLQMMGQGFVSVDVFREALAAFAECDTCGWARQMQQYPEMWESIIARRLQQMGKS